MGFAGDISNSAKKAVVGRLINVAISISPSDENIVRFTHVLERLVTKKNRYLIAGIRKLVKEKHPSYRLIRNMIDNCDPHCVKKMMNNLVVGGLVGNERQREEDVQKGNAGPFSILFSPTMRCNLKCEGCYANRYSQKDDMSFETMDKIVREGKEMGVGFFTLLGGEPFLKKDLYDIFKKHNDCYFQAYTNGSLINEELCLKLKKVGNVFPQISLEGFEKETDERRGKGTYKKVMEAMDLLRKHRLPFGFSVCVTRKNVETVFSDKFIDMIIEKGGFFGWYFLYMPVCGSPDMSLMPTPQQRLHMMERGKYIRANKPIFIVDFWNDAPSVGGCIAGKYYAHINSEGYVEPCIFTHFATDNIKDKHLRECLNSPYFRELRRRQPFNDNLYLPCQWIDNPEVSRELHKKFNLKSTHPGAEDVIVKKELREAIDRYSEEVKEVFKEPWEEKKSFRNVILTNGRKTSKKEDKAVS